MSINNRGVTDTKLIDRITVDLRISSKQHTMTERWKLTVRKRRAAVKTFVLSKCDYFLYFQPMTQKTELLAEELDRKSTA